MLSESPKVQRRRVISQNLDALLEHDERSRSLVPASPTFSQGPPSASVNSMFLTGLTPSPRQSRTLSARAQADSDSGTTNRRYSRLFLQTENLEVFSSGTPQLSPASPAMVTFSRSMNDEPSVTAAARDRESQSPLTPPVRADINFQLIPPVSAVSDGSFFSIEEYSSSGHSHIEQEQDEEAEEAARQQDSPAHDPLEFPDAETRSPRDEEAVTTQRNFLHFLSEFGASRDQTRADTFGKAQIRTSNLRERAWNQGKILKIQDPSMQPASEVLPTIIQGRQSTGSLVAVRNLKLFEGVTQPQLSHDHMSSSSMSQYFPSDSSHEPLSSSHRISISSTFYSTENSSHSPYSPISYHQMQDPTHDDGASSLALSPSRESFLDILSPSSPDSDAHGGSWGAVMQHENTNLTTFTRSENDPAVSHDRRKSESLSRPPSSSKGTKPPLPTIPKPNFSRPTSPLVFSMPSPRGSPPPTARNRSQEPGARHDATKETGVDLPPTTNFLSADERADLVRKSRKLAQVFGQTPGASAFSQKFDDYRPPLFLAPTTNSNSDKPRYHRAAASISSEIPIIEPGKKALPPWPPAEGTQYLTASGRRHSVPISPDDVSFLETENSPTSLIDIGAVEGVSNSDWSELYSRQRNAPGSPTSFIDLSEEEAHDDGISAIITLHASKKPGRHKFPASSATSILENMTLEERLEEDRRRKREKLAKVHRFLGSRVPPELVLGLNNSNPALGALSDFDPPLEDRKAMIRRRRSSSAAALPSTRSENIERMKEDLNEKEKAINVRRAQKMEKVFGVMPPQTLYHTRHAPSQSVSAVPLLSTSFKSPFDAIPTSPGYRNLNRSAYSKLRMRKNDRPSTAESSRQLLPTLGPAWRDPSPEPSSHNVYSSYQQSLTTLNDIIDRDDRASLAELHDYLNDDYPSAQLTKPLTKVIERRPSNASSLRTERRLSLPARTSIISIASDLSTITIKPEVSEDFQLRRRKAAKLTQFFGVDYRDLIKDVLESIEKGLEEERKRGTLKPNEVEDLLHRLRSLKTKRDGIAQS